MRVILPGSKSRVCASLPKILRTRWTSQPKACLQANSKSNLRSHNRVRALVTMRRPIESEDPLPKIHVKGKKQFAAKRIGQTQAAQSKAPSHQNQNASTTQISEASTAKPPSVQSIAGKKRNVTEVDGAQDRQAVSQPEPKRKTFSYLKKHTRRVPQDVIKRRWKALPVPAQQQVRELFSTAKRSVMHGTKNERRAREIEAALGAVLRRLEKQLPRMPFPPKSREGDFSLDGIVARMVGLLNHHQDEHNTNVLSSESWRRSLRRRYIRLDCWKVQLKRRRSCWRGTWRPWRI